MLENETVAAPEVKNILHTYGQRFKQARAEARVAQGVLHTHLGISKQALAQFEAGKQGLDLRRFAAACEAVGANPAWVLYGRQPMLDAAPTVAVKARRARGIA